MQYEYFSDKVQFRTLKFNWREEKDTQRMETQA